MTTLERIAYGELNSRQKESYNFQKVSAVLADFGFTTIRLSDDWQNADFIAQHMDQVTFLKVQLKGRVTFAKKYEGKKIFIAFPRGGAWYLYPHDELLKKVLDSGIVGDSSSWREKGGYSFRGISRQMNVWLAKYQISGAVQTKKAQV